MTDKYAMSIRQYTRILVQASESLAGSPIFKDIVASLRASRQIAKYTENMKDVDRIAIFKFSKEWYEYAISEELKDLGLLDADSEDIEHVQNAMSHYLSEAHKMKLEVWEHPESGWMIWDVDSVSVPLQNAGWPEELVHETDYVPPLRSPPRSYDANESI